MVSKTSLGDRDLRLPHRKELHLQLPHRTTLAFCCQTQKVPEISLWRGNLVRQSRVVNPKASTMWAGPWQWVGMGSFSQWSMLSQCKWSCPCTIAVFGDCRVTTMSWRFCLSWETISLTTLRVQQISEGFENHYLLRIPDFK